MNVLNSRQKFRKNNNNKKSLRLSQKEVDSIGLANFVAGIFSRSFETVGWSFIQLDLERR